MWAIALTAFVIVALYFARGLLIPFALSALLTFLISPLVGRLERWLGRVAAVVLAVGLIFGALGCAGWMVSRQLVDLATRLPEYKGNIVTKLHAFQPPKGGIFSKVFETVDELKKELPGGSPEPTITQESGKPETAVASPPHPPVPAAAVKVVETSEANPVELIKTIITPLIGPLGTAFLVLILVIFMLFEREDLRSRLIRLIGQGRISITTHAMDDAAARVSRYLRMQLETPMPAMAVPYRVCCLPARDEGDELAGTMLAQLLQQRGFEAASAPGKLVAGELLSFAEKADVDVVCISVVVPSTIIHARYLCKKVRAKFPKVKIIVGLWGTTTENKAESAQRLRDSGADEMVVSLDEAVEQIIKSAPLLTEGMSPAPIPEDEEERLAALAELQLLDTEAEPAFDRIIAKLARVFEMPIALISLVDRHRLFFKSHTGLPEDLAESRQASRDVSVCGYVVSNNEVTVIEDLARDRRFANNPWIRERGLRFYAGAPLHAPNGQPIGSLCLLDVKPREFSSRDRRHLQEYASEVMEEIDRRSSALSKPKRLEAAIPPDPALQNA